MPELLRAIAIAGVVEANWLARSLTDVLLAAQAMLPEEDFTLALLEVAAAAGERHQQATAGVVLQRADV